VSDNEILDACVERGGAHGLFPVPPAVAGATAGNSVRSRPRFVSQSRPCAER
jgi:hypothetical protein